MVRTAGGWKESSGCAAQNRQAWRRCGGFCSLRSVTAMAHFPPSAWNGSWNDAPDNPSAAGAVSAMTCAIIAASAHGARGRTSCKRQSNVSRFLGVLPSCDASPPSPPCASGRQEEDDQPNCHARIHRETPALFLDELKQRLQNRLDDRAITPRFVDLAEPSALPRSGRKGTRRHGGRPRRVGRRSA